MAVTAGRQRQRSNGAADDVSRVWAELDVVAPKFVAELFEAARGVPLYALVVVCPDVCVDVAEVDARD